jgi:small basic protein (TIGR04137 family)
MDFLADSIFKLQRPEILLRFRPSLWRKNMSQHRSLRTSSATATKRNVLKRFERVALLKKRGQWKNGDRVLGLRKTKPDA